MEQLPGVFGTVAPYLSDYGYVALAALLFLDNLGVPLPSEAVMITAAVFAGAGQLNIYGVAAIAFVACVLGGNGSYGIGRYGGRPLVEHLGRRIGMTAARLDRVEEFFGRYGVRLILVARFIPGLRQCYGLVAGTTRMPFWRFQVANVGGAALWTLVWSVVGYKAGGHLETIDRVITRSAPVLLVLAVVTIVVLARRRRRRRIAGALVPDDQAPVSR